MQRTSTDRAMDLARLLLYVGLLLGATERVWSQGDHRERGARGSYSDPVERPTLPMPGSKKMPREQIAAGPSAAGNLPQRQAALGNRAPPAPQSEVTGENQPAAGPAESQRAQPGG